MGVTKGRQPIRRFFNPNTMPDFLPNAPADGGVWPEQGGKSNLPSSIREVSARSVTRRSPPDRIKELQRSLAAAGFDPGKVDGRMGPRTERAVRAFQKANGLEADGIPGPKTLGRLASGTAEGPSRLPRPRPEQPWGPPGAFPAGREVQGPPSGALPKARPFETQLSASEERQFQAWKRTYAPNDSGEDYDLRGAFKAGITPDRTTGHMPDTFKKPNHPTFSVESQYASAAPGRAGRWMGDVYVPAGSGGGIGSDVIAAPSPPLMRSANPQAQGGPPVDAEMPLAARQMLAERSRPAAIPAAFPQQTPPLAYEEDRTGREPFNVSAAPEMPLGPPPQNAMGSLLESAWNRLSLPAGDPRNNKGPPPSSYDAFSAGQTGASRERPLVSDEDISDALSRYFEPEEPAAPPNALGNAMREFFSPLGLGPPPAPPPEALQGQGMSTLRSMPESPQEFTGTNDSEQLRQAFDPGMEPIPYLLKQGGYQGFPLTGTSLSDRYRWDWDHGRIDTRDNPQFKRGPVWERAQPLEQTPMTSREVPQETIGTNDSAGDSRSMFRRMLEASGDFLTGGSPPAAPDTAARQGGDIQYVSPVTGTLATAGHAGEYGDRRGGGGRRHAGVDFQAADGSPVVASIAGKVVLKGNDPGGYDEYAVVLGNDGNLQRYATHGTVSVKRGDSVQPGDPIGTIGRGHLHFETIPPGSEAFTSMVNGEKADNQWWGRGPTSLTRDPTDFLETAYDTSLKLGQPVNADAMDARREKQVQEARSNLPMRGPNDMGPPPPVTAQTQPPSTSQSIGGRYIAPQVGGWLKNIQDFHDNFITKGTGSPEIGSAPVGPVASGSLAPLPDIRTDPRLAMGPPSNLGPPDPLQSPFPPGSEMPATPNEQMAAGPSAPMPMPMDSELQRQQARVGLPPGALPGAPPQMASVNPDPLMDPNLMMAPGPMQGQVDPFAPPTGMLTPPPRAPLGPPQPDVTARLPQARPPGGPPPEYYRAPRPRPEFVGNLPRPRPDDPSAPGKPRIINGVSISPDTSPFDAISIIDGDFSRRVPMSDDKLPPLSQPPLTAGPIDGALGSMNSGLGPRSFWDAFNARPQGPTDIARASRLAADLYKSHRKEDKDDAERRKMAEARAVAIISQAAAGGMGNQNHGGGGMFGGGWGGWGGWGGNYQGPGGGGHSNKSGY